MRRITARTTLAAATLLALLASGTTASAFPPAPPLNPCLAAKVKCVVKKKTCLLNVEAKARKKGLAPDAVKLQKCRDKFTGGADPTRGCFARAEADPLCLTSGDVSAIECKIDAFVEDAVEELDTNPAPNIDTCAAGKIKCLRKRNKCLLTVYSKAAKTGVLDPNKVQKCLDRYTGGADPTKGCFAKVEAEGGCNTLADRDTLAAKDDAFIDDVLSELNIGPTEIQNQRCTGDTSVQCASAPGGVGGCGGLLGTCEFWFGSTQPVAAGGVSVCLTNQFDGPISGTWNVDTGDSIGIASVISRIHSGLTLAEPCPRCINDIWINDGAPNGTCSGGARDGLPCDANGSIPTFGITSLDCPPFGGALIAAAPLDLSHTTGVASRTLTAASPDCRAPGFGGFKCFCETCNNAAAEICDDNADCPDPPGPIGPICGGRRCIGGANDGVPCTASSECSGGGFCSTVGAGSRPNECADDTCSPNTPPDRDSCNEGTCAGGPFESFCSPTETFRTCLNNADCMAPGDTCSFGEFRECYTDNGAVGESVQACGEADPPVEHWSTPRLASLSCLVPTTSPAVNLVTGRPGLQRLELPVRARDDGTDVTCPSHIDFVASTLKGVRDSGWTGIAHDLKIVSGGLVTVAISGCTPGVPPANCGTCTYSGPVANTNPPN